MKRLLLIILLIYPVVAAQNTFVDKANRPVFKELLSNYKRFQDIHPTLENVSDKSIFLCSLYPQAAAHLSRFNSKTKKWEAGRWPRYCASVNDVTKPIEIKPGEKFAPNIYWQVSMGGWDKPIAFETTEDQKRPLRGKYKLTIAYAQEPWTLGNFPKARYYVSSDEFFVEP